jgi:hypothetical protein
VAVNCTFTENQGRSGAGMYDGVATNCTFRSNYADEGAGMFGGIATNCLFDSNTAIEEGGGMYSGMGHSYLPEFETVATNSLFVSNSARAGGGMFGGTAVNSTFDSNTASSGGGLYDGTAIDSVFLRNSAHSGGGMNGTESHVATNCRFERNSAEEYGGGIYEATANKCTFISNTARVGGGIYGGRPTDCLFFSNTASSWGGGLHASYIEARRCTFVANSAGMYGGGMYEGTATDCTFMSNSADTGGGLHSGIAERCVFASNFADTSGGGTHDSRLINSILVSNGTNGEGGGMYEGNAANCTFVSNTSPNYGQGATEAHVANCIFGNGPADGLDRTYCAQADGVDELAAIFNGFPLLTGTWSSVSFDDTAYQTTLVTPEGSFEENELVGLFVQPDTTQPWWFEIASNTTDTIVVLADLRTNRDGDDFVQEGDAYQLYDLHLKDDSPCIDAGSHSQAPFQDKEGVYRTDNPNVPNSGAGPYWADQGAYESGDGKDAVCGAPIVHSHYYYVCEGERTAQDAAAYCARLGFDNHHVVTLESSAENEFVTSLTDRVLWIGAAEGGDEGEWSWQSDGSWGNFLNWEDEYPQTDFQVSCAIMGDNPDRQWRDVPCTEEHFFICELYGG